MSGIYIPRLEELKCDECFWCIGYRIKCPAGNREVLLGIKHPDCPLVHVPDHGRLVDADALVSNLLISRKEICNAPTILPGEEATNGE